MIASAACLSSVRARAGLRRYDEDTALMLRLQAGDRAAMRPLLERNHQRILNIAFRFSGDPSQAEEIAQETFTRVYQARERYRPQRPFRAYVARIATNLCI